MSHASSPFDHAAHEARFHAAVARFHQRLVTILGEIDADIAARGFSGASGHSRIGEAIETVRGVFEELRQVDEEAGAYLLEQARIERRTTAVDPFQQSCDLLTRWLESEAKLIPERMEQQTQRLIVTNAVRDHWDHLARHACSQLEQDASSWYARNSAKFQQQLARIAQEGAAEQAKEPQQISEQIDQLAEQPFSGPESSTDCEDDRYVFRRHGQMWQLVYGEESVSLPHSKGLTAIQRLLENPGKHVPVSELGDGEGTTKQRSSIGLE